MSAVPQPNVPRKHQPDVVEAAVQRVMHLVADHWPHVVLWRWKSTGLRVCVWKRRVGLGAGWRPQQGRGRSRGWWMLLPLDADGRRCGEA